MSSITDRVFNEVCLDERISDGIFRMEEEQHMNALRDYFIKKGITKEAAIHVTNRMVEGKYPERQAYRAEDGILVTWPSPKHMQKAMQENPGKYVKENPFPKKPSADQPAEPKKQTLPATSPKDDEEPIDKEEPSPEEKDQKHSNLFGGGGGGEEPKITQGDKQLAIEPPRGDEKPEPSPAPISSPAPAPRTPERIAAEKEVVKQIMKTDDTYLSNVADPINETCRKQLNELYKKAYELGFKEAVTFLTPYIKP